MEKEIYSPMEKVLIKGTIAMCGDDCREEVIPASVAAEWLETKKKMNDALLLDSMLLELEAKADMMDGLTMKEWIL